jgi:hypothetical protein
LKLGNVEDKDAVQKGTQSAIATKTHPNERENIMLFLQGVRLDHQCCKQLRSGTTVADKLLRAGAMLEGY